MESRQLTTMYGLLNLNNMTMYDFFLFIDVDDPTNLMLLAAMNGISNGFGWPCVVRMVRMWYVSPCSFLSCMSVGLVPH